MAQITAYSQGSFMPSAVSWLDHSESDQQRVRELLQMFTDKETVDDLGLGTIRDAISNQMFPGSSTIQTRARYFLFIPWMFQRAQARNPTNVVAKAQDMERLLIKALLNGGETSGVIGREAGQNLKTLPSAIYWGGLLRYEIFRARGRTIRQYGRMVARGMQPPDFEEELVERTPSFWTEMPPPPETFFRFEKVDFTLTLDEADWLAERFLGTETALSGPNLMGEFVRGLRRGGPAPVDADFAWDAPLPSSTPAAIQDLLHEARQFSLLANGAALLYNLLLTKAIDATATGPRAWDRDYLEELAAWAAECDDLGLRDWCASTDSLWTALSAGGASVGDATRQFVTDFATLVHELGPAAISTNEAAHDLIRTRELAHKRGQARFRNEKRLLAYPGYAGTSRMNYRWPLVRQLLEDLADGFANTGTVDADA